MKIMSTVLLKSLLPISAPSGARITEIDFTVCSNPLFEVKKECTWSAGVMPTVSMRTLLFHISHE